MRDTILRPRILKLRYLPHTALAKATVLGRHNNYYPERIVVAPEEPLSLQRRGGQEPLAAWAYSMS
jgi:hypothetical protein